MEGRRAARKPRRPAQAYCVLAAVVALAAAVTADAAEKPPPDEREAQERPWLTAEPPVPKINPLWRTKLRELARPQPKPDPAAIAAGDPAGAEPLPNATRDQQDPRPGAVFAGERPDPRTCVGGSWAAISAGLADAASPLCRAVAMVRAQVTADPVTTGSIPATAGGPAGSPASGSRPGHAATSPQQTGAPRGGDGHPAPPPPDRAVPEFDLRNSPADGERQGIRLRARLTEDMQPISRAVEWTVFAVEDAVRGKWRQVVSLSDPAPEIPLAAGDYVIHARYGHVTARKIITVGDGRLVDATFILNAGGLRILSTLAHVDPPPGERAVHFIYSAGTDASGTRELVAKSDLPGEIIRLNSGTYRIVSRFGSANVQFATDVTVKPGLLSAVEISHKAAVVEIDLAAGDDEPPDDTGSRWWIVDAAGNRVAEGLSPAAAFVIAPGTYRAFAEVQGRHVEQAFEARTGETKRLALGGRPEWSD